MLQEIQTLVRRPNCYKVSFEYDNVYNNVYVTCIIRDEYYKDKPKYRVLSLSDNEDEALAESIKLLNRMKDLGNIEWPNLNKQTTYYGYYREFISEHIQVEYKRIGDEFFVTGIEEIHNGFHVVEHPYDVPKHYEFIGKVDEGDLYSWDEIGPLCGSAGKAIAKDGKIIYKKAEFMS